MFISCENLGKVYYLTQSAHGKKKFRFGFRFFNFTTDILNVNPDVFTLLCSWEYSENESMDEESGNISEEPRYICVFITFIDDILFTSLGHYWILCL